MSAPSVQKRLHNRLPDQLRAAVRALRGRAASRLDVRYRRIAADERGRFAQHNTRGTHLNESGDLRSAAQYVATFDPAQEVRNWDVAATLAFIDSAISPRLPAQASVLDVGCGSGRYAHFLRRPGAPTIGWRYCGIERSDEIVQYARRLCPDCEFRSSHNTVTLPCADRSHDLVMANGVLQYTADAWRTLLSELVRVARRYVLIGRLPLVRHTASHDCLQTVNQREHHLLTILSRADFEQAISACGATIVARDYSAEVISVRGVAEPVVYNLYLIAVAAESGQEPR